MSEQTKPLYQQIASTFGALERCRENNNTEWASKHEETLQKYETLLPSGSGFDNGTVLVHELSDPDGKYYRVPRLVFRTSFHHMNDVGMYTKWTDHDIIVTPSFDGIDIKVKGPDYRGIKDMILEAFYYALKSEV